MRGARTHPADIATLVLAALTALGVIVLAASLPAYWQVLHQPCVSDGCEPRLSPRGLGALGSLGLSLTAYCGFFLALVVAFATLCVAVGSFILYRRPRDPSALTAAGAVAMLGVTFPATSADLAAAHPQWRVPAAVVGIAGQVLTVVFFYWFPQRPRLRSWLTVPVAVWTLAVIPSQLVPDSGWAFGGMPEALNAALVLGCLAPIPVVQLVRYRRCGDRSVRAQIREVAGALALALVLLVAVSAAETSVGGGAPLHDRPGANLLAQAVIYLGMALVPLAVAVAVTRRGLWDLRAAVHRTLVYGALSVAVLGLYVGLLLLGTRLLVVSTSVAAVVAAPVAALAASPLRARLQRAVNRLMFGWRDDPHLALADLGHRLHAAPTSAEVVGAIRDTVQRSLPVGSAVMWLADGSALSRPDVAAADLVIDPHAVAALARAGLGLAPDELPPGAFAGAAAEAGASWLTPLVREDALVAVLAVGIAGGAAPSTREAALLADLARHAAPAVQAAVLTARLERSLGELRVAGEALVRSQDAERSRIHRDLHDGLGPTLASLRLRLEACVDAAVVDGDQRLADDLLALHQLVGRCTADIRGLVHDLRPPGLDQLGVVATIEQHCEQAARDSGVPVVVTVAGSEREAVRLDSATEVALLRVTQEAVHNACRHARASRIDVHLGLREDTVEVSVVDDGVGVPAALAPPGPGGGHGLASMRQRAALLGGELAICPRPDGGTAVRLTLPVRPRHPVGPAAGSDA